MTDQHHKLHVDCDDAGRVAVVSTARGNLLVRMGDALSVLWCSPCYLAASILWQAYALKCGHLSILGPRRPMDNKSTPLLHGAPGQCRDGVGALRYAGAGERHPNLESDDVLLGVLSSIQLEIRQRKRRRLSKGRLIG